MKTVLMLFVVLGASLFAAEATKFIKEGDKWPELVLRDGRTFRSVMFSRVTEGEVRFVHADGITTLKNPAEELPESVGWSAKPDAQREAEALQARAGALEREAVNLMQSTGRTLDELRVAIRCREWCLTNPNGGVIETAAGPREFTKAKRDEQLQIALAILGTKRTNEPAYQAAVPVPAQSGGSLSERGARPVGRSMNDPQRQAEVRARQQRMQGGGGAPLTIESTIDGKFEGFEHGRLFKLLNGQIWEQSDFKIHYYYAYNPRVRVFMEAGGYQMKVEGVDETIQVRMR